MDRWMGGWMDWLIDGWMDGYMDELIDRCIHGWTCYVWIVDKPKYDFQMKQVQSLVEYK